MTQLPENALAQAVIWAKSAIKTAASEGSIGQMWRVVESLDASAKLRSTGRDSWCRAFIVDDKKPSFARGMKDGKILPNTIRDRKGELLITGETYLAIWLGHLHDAYSQSCSSRRLTAYPMDRLKTEFRETEGYVGGPYQIRLSDDKSVPRRECYIFHLDEQRANCVPDWVREMAQAREIVQPEDAE